MYKFEKLRVWSDGLLLIKSCYQLCKYLPKSEEMGLISQLKRSSTSICLNIAEGSGAENDLEFKRYLYIAKKSLFEVVGTVKVIENLYQLEIEPVITASELVGKQLSSLIKYLKNDKSNDQESMSNSAIQTTNS